MRGTTLTLVTPNGRDWSTKLTIIEGDTMTTTAFKDAKTIDELPEGTFLGKIVSTFAISEDGKKCRLIHEGGLDAVEPVTDLIWFKPLSDEEIEGLGFKPVPSTEWERITNDDQLLALKPGDKVKVDKGGFIEPGIYTVKKVEQDWLYTDVFFVETPYVLFLPSDFEFSRVAPEPEPEYAYIRVEITDKSDPWGYGEFDVRALDEDGDVFDFSVPQSTLIPEADLVPAAEADAKVAALEAKIEELDDQAEAAFVDGYNVALSDQVNIFDLRKALKRLDPEQGDRMADIIIPLAKGLGV